MTDQKKGRIHFYLGQGKGKTTAAMGLALRAIGREKKVIICQFLKSSVSGEILAFNKMAEAGLAQVRIFRGKEGSKFSFAMNEEELAACTLLHNQHLQQIRELCSQGEVDLLILDEVLDAWEKNLLDRDFLADFIHHKPYALEIVLTGRRAEEAILADADYITEMKKLRHPFDEGLKSRLGVEY